MKREDFIRASKEARETMEELARLFPGCFTKEGKPVIASAHFVPLQKRCPHGLDQYLCYTCVNASKQATHKK